MNCHQTDLLLHAYADSELGVVESMEVAGHIEACPACAGKLENFRVLRASLRSEGLYYRAPAALEQRIRVRFGTPPQAVRTRFQAGPWLAAAAAVILVLLAGQFIGRQLRNSAPSELARDVLTSHVRSMIGDHLLDVRSSDHHTVKPWFSSKLDYSPPVTNLADNGFPLIGGRMDYLNSRNVATLIYQRRRHIINCYVYPEAGGETTIAAQSQNGFHEEHWRHHGMDYWLVSDLNETELTQLAKLLVEKQ